MVKTTSNQFYGIFLFNVNVEYLNLDKLPFNKYLLFGNLTLAFPSATK
jgi:hypothetical protein